MSARGKSTASQTFDTSICLNRLGVKPEWRLMEKSLEMGITSARGSLHLFLGVALSTVIMAVGTIVLARLLMPAEYGLYTVALAPSLMIGLFGDWGISSAITKYTACARVENKEEDIRGIIAAGLIFEAMAGLALSLISFFLATFIASAIFHRPESTPLISFASFTIFANSLLVAIQSSFAGFERMELSSITMICQSVVKTVASPLLVLLGLGALGAMIGYTVSFLAATIIGVVVLYFALLRSLKRTQVNRSQIYRTLRAMLRYGVPLSASTIVAGFQLQFYSFMMAFYCDNVTIGNYQAANNFAVLLTFVTVPISTVLFPAFAKVDPKNEQELLRTIFTSSVKYTALFLVPATMGVMILAKPMVSSLFGETYTYAPYFLTLYVISNLFTVFGGLSMRSLLAGVGETKVIMKLSLLTLIFGLSLAFLLVPAFGVVGVILGNLFAGLPSLFWGLHWVLRHYHVKAEVKSSAKILLASTLAALPAYLITNALRTSEWVRLVIGITIFLAIYIFTAPTIGAVTQTDINNLRAMFSGMGLLSKLINIPLTIAERIAKSVFGSKKQL